MNPVKAGYVFVLTAACAQAAYFRELLPARVATHFDSAGLPNGWMERDVHLMFSVGLVAFLSALFLLARFSITRLPPSRLNIPNKAYWLAPERRDETVRRVAGQVELIGLVVGAGLLAMLQMVNRVNLAPHPVLPTERFLFWLACVVGTGIFVVLRMAEFQSAGVSRHNAIARLCR